MFPPLYEHVRCSTLRYSAIVTDHAALVSTRATDIAVAQRTC
jgi:hypothetical protein